MYYSIAAALYNRSRVVWMYYVCTFLVWLSVYFVPLHIRWLLTHTGPPYLCNQGYLGAQPVLSLISAN